VIDLTNAPTALLDWPGLSTAVRTCAVVVIADEANRIEAWAWLRAGVQDVLPRARTDDAELARAVALSVKRWQQQEDVRRAWSIDLDTGLPNRAQLMELLHQLCALREREPAPMALAVFRLEGLAGCDAGLGVAAAPTLRRKLAVRLRSGLRASDVVAAVDAHCFAVLLTRLDAPQDAQKVAGKLARALQGPLSFAGQPVLVGVSSGVALHPLHAQRPEELLKLAMAAAGEQGPAGSGRLGQRGEAANDG
jgi:GGDEF domain-containing protein